MELKASATPLNRHTRSTRSLLAFLLAILALLTGCSSRWQATDDSPSDTLTAQQRFALLATAESQLGAPYKWGGQSPQDGFDCSGLIVWSLAQQEISTFRHQNGWASDVTADNLFTFNSTPINRPAKGDLAFFDADGNGHIEHVAIVHRIDGDQVWLLDAGHKKSDVKIRYISNLNELNVAYGRLIQHRHP